MKPFSRAPHLPIALSLGLLAAGGALISANPAYANYPGALAALLLTGCSDPKEFNGIGDYELWIEPNVEFESEYISGTSTYGSGDLFARLGNSNQEEAITLSIEEPANPKRKNNIRVDIGNGLETVNLEATYPYPGKENRVGLISQPTVNYGKLSDYLLPSQTLSEGDCNIDLDRSIEFFYENYGNVLTVSSREILSFDESQSCRSALAELSDKIWVTGQIPSLFITAAFYHGLDLSRLADLREITFTGTQSGGKIKDAQSDTGDSSPSASKSNRGSLLPEMKKTRPMSAAENKKISAEILKRY